MAKKTSTATIVAEVGAGLAAAAAAAGAGYYFYASDDAKKHRRAAVKWASDLKSDVVKEARRMGKDIDAASIASAVDTAISTYQAASSISRADLERAADELKRNWELVRSEALAQGARAVKRGKKAAKRAGASAKKVARGALKRGRATAKKVAKKAKKGRAATHKARKATKKAAGKKTRR